MSAFLGQLPLKRAVIKVLHKSLSFIRRSLLSGKQRLCDGDGFTLTS